MKCPRSNCNNEAINHPIFGIIPCQACTDNDIKVRLNTKFEFSSLNKQDRVQTQRDHHKKDLLQPYEQGKANKEFFEAYPERVETYKVQKELEKM